MDYIKCEICGKYDEPTTHNLNPHGIVGKNDLCNECISKEERWQLEYDAKECGYDSVDEYVVQLSMSSKKE